MKTVSTTYKNNSESNLRDISQEVKIKWNPLTDYSFETDKVLSIIVDRSTILPLGGMMSAEAEVILDNTDGRFLSNS